jgi:hypothetical protein
MRVRGQFVITTGRIQSIQETMDLLDEARERLVSMTGVEKPNEWCEEHHQIVVAAENLEGMATTRIMSAKQSLYYAAEAESRRAAAWKVFEAHGDLAAEEFRLGVILTATLDKALGVVKMIYKIQRGADDKFIALGDLYNEVLEVLQRQRQGELGADDALRVGAELAAKADEIARDLVLFLPFDPWRAALFGPRGLKTLLNAISDLRQGMFLPALKKLAVVLRALSKLVEGADARAGEITEIKRLARRRIA